MTWLVWRQYRAQGAIAAALLAAAAAVILADGCFPGPQGRSPVLR